METLEHGEAGSTDDLLTLLAQNTDLSGFLDEIVRVAARQVPAAQACGLTLEKAPTGTTVAATGPLAVAADERQYADGEGPCLQAMWDGVVVRVDDMTREERWGAYPAHCAAIGVCASLSIPLVVGDRGRGALNLYSGRAHAFTDDDETVAARWGAQATGALAVALRLADSEARADSLAAGLDSRTVIGTAIGLLMAQERCTSGQAFDLLKIASQRRNVKLRDVAAGIVAAHEATVDGSPARW